MAINSKILKVLREKGWYAREGIQHQLKRKYKVLSSLQSIDIHIMELKQRGIIIARKERYGYIYYRLDTDPKQINFKKASLKKDIPPVPAPSNNLLSGEVFTPPLQNASFNVNRDSVTGGAGQFELELI